MLQNGTFKTHRKIELERPVHSNTTYILFVTEVDRLEGLPGYASYKVLWNTADHMEGAALVAKSIKYHTSTFKSLACNDISFLYAS